MTMTSRWTEAVRFTALAAGVAVAGVIATATSLKARMPPTQLDQQQLEQNADLYSVARAYFPSDDAGAPSKRIFRLTRDQIDASVTALLPSYKLPSVKTALSKDPTQTNYEFAELIGFNSANIGALTKWISEIAAEVQKRPTGVVNCPGGAAATECLKTQARAFVVKAFRGDVDDKRIKKAVDFFLDGVTKVGVEQATAELVEVVLNSPHFLFRKELSVDDASRLTSAQLLQTLSYTLTDAPPEKLGLKSGAELGSTVDAILKSGDAREKLVRFFSAWLEIRQPGEFTISTMLFPEFTPQLAGAMLEETNGFLRSHLAAPAPKLKDITQATRSIIPKPLAAIYAAKPDDAGGGKPVALDPTQRLGIFTQPAVIASHSGPTDTRLVKRGVFWVRKVMCMELEPPPTDVHVDEYAQVVTTERDRIEQSTQPAACVGCHKLINPFGFMLERYDALGRWRAKDNGHPIDTRIAHAFLDEGPGTASEPVEALKTFTGSMMFKQCFVRQMFRFYMGRAEEPSDDPVLRRMFFEFANNDEQDIMKALRTLALSDRLTNRQ